MPTSARNAERAGRRDRWWLAGVCGAFGALSLAVVHPGLPLGWDELVYASRFVPYGPETPFSAPRTRGVPLLIAPVAAVGHSVPLLRCYLTVAAALALYLGFLPWLRAVARRGVVPLAAALYSSVWFALFYAGAAMPNHYVAMGLTAAFGCCVPAPEAASSSGPGSGPGASYASAAAPGSGRGPGPVRDRVRTWAAVPAALAAATLIRPNDTVWPVAVLLGAALWTRLSPGRRGPGRGPGGSERGRPPRSGAPASTSASAPAPGVAVAASAGVLLGLLPWAVEARLRFGGVLERVRAAGDIQGGMHLHLSLDTVFRHAAALDGPLLCRPCEGVTVGWASAAWWLLIPPLLALGVNAARKEGRTALAVLPTAAAAAVAVPYLFFMDYAAPRFLLPAYALLAPVAALGVCGALRRARAARKLWLLAPLGATAALLHLGFQLHQLDLHSGIQAAARQDWQRMERVLRAHGVRPPCVLAGNSSTIPVAHTAGCRPAAQGHPAAEDPQAAEDHQAAEDRPAAGRPATGGRPHALVLRGVPLPAWAARAGWRLHPVPHTYNPGWRIAVPPPTVLGAPPRPSGDRLPDEQSSDPVTAGEDAAHGRARTR
ncbi:hypothetical protein [Streptomyces qinglanensis]|uniref:Integral membrane protein n=1 Tax=Streptomyces qinglanensis TaxID=943816 RepID=A0A1H9V9W8_9ACTN|nr:hypothetical protein [Streptomyces qinglanensis]SES18053.1 hypothetical protein SAMN05421870_11111 [Streptomyces qinglanensis]